MTSNLLPSLCFGRGKGILLLCCWSFLCCWSLLCCWSSRLFCSRLSILASCLAGAAWLCLLALLGSSLLVSFLCLALLKTLCNSCAACRENSLYRVLCIIIGRYYKVNRLWIAICSFITSTTKSADGRRVRSDIEPRFFSSFAR